MIQGRTILCFASGYDAPPTSKHHVMHLLADRNVVLWVNYHASRTPSANSSDMLYMAKKLKQVCSPMVRVRPNLYVVTPLALPLPAQSWAKAVNRELIVRRLKAALARVQRGPLQVWSFTPDVAYLVDAFRPEKVVYYCVDDFAEFSGYNREQVLRDEAELARRADLVITTSLALQKAKQALNPNTVLVPHGVDYDHFAKAWREELTTPADLAGIPHPIFGFFGLIRDWIDVDLVAAAARLRPDYHFVFIGDSRVDLAPYRALANMHFLGPKLYGELPAYCRAFDAGLIPFKLNDLTLAVNPIKLREYLAAGLPVISTALPEVALYGDLVHIVKDAEELAEAADAVLAEGPEEAGRRREAMANETWPEKVELISRSMPAEVSGTATR